MGCAKKQSLRLQSAPNRQGFVLNLRLSFFSDACPPPHFKTLGAAVPSTSSLALPDIPLAVNSTSLAATVTFSSTQSGQRNLASSSFLWPTCERQASQTRTGTPHVLHFFFPTYRSHGLSQRQHLASGILGSVVLVSLVMTPPSPSGFFTSTASRLSNTKFFPRQCPPSGKALK